MTGSTRYQWIGKIPSDWEILKISHTTYVKGRIGWHGLNTEEFIDEGPYCVTGTDLKDGIVDWPSCYHVSEERCDQDPYIQLKESDLLLTKDGTIGKCGIVVGLNGKATLNSGLFVIRPEKDIYMTRFLYWIIQSQVFDNFITLTKIGTTISHLYQNVFEGFRFPVPKIEIQKQIADFLDKETTRIDTLISKKQTQIELLQEKRQSIITQSVTKGLNPNVKMKNSGVEWIGEVPEHWEVRKLKTLTRRITKGTTPSTIGSELLDKGDVRFLKAENITEDGSISENPVFYIDRETDRLLQRSRILENDLLFVIAGATIGKVSIVNSSFVPSNTNQNVSIVRLRESNQSPYVLKILQSSFVKVVIDLNKVQSAQPNISMENLGNIQVPLPPPSEMEKVLEHILVEEERVQTVTRLVNSSINLLKEYRSSLITHAVSGQIDISKYEVSK